MVSIDNDTQARTCLISPHPHNALDVDSADKC